MTRVPRRVFIGTLEVGGYYRALAAGLRAIGIRADNLDAAAHPYAYGALDARPRPILLIEGIGRRRERARHTSRVRFVAWTVALRIALAAALAWSLVHYDAYIFGFNMTFLSTYDLPLLRLFGKRIVMVYHGSDIRPTYMDGTEMDPRSGRGPAAIAPLMRRKVGRLRRAERYAHHVVSHPLYSQLLRRPALSYLALGVPMAPPAHESPPPPGAGTVRILHAPSNESVKGSDRIRAAIRELEERGLDIDYREIVGRPNAEVLAAIEDTTIVIDQVYSDLPYSIFGAEAAARRRPVVVAGYGRSWIEQLLGELPPVHWCEPEGLVEGISAIVGDAERRVRLAAQGREVLRAWEPASVAERYRSVLTGDVDPRWWFDPREFAYPLGCGLPRERVVELVRAVLASDGAAGLQVDHNPRLRDALVDLATNLVAVNDRAARTLEPDTAVEGARSADSVVRRSE